MSHSIVDDIIGVLLRLARAETCAGGAVILLSTPPDDNRPLTYPQRIAAGPCDPTSAGPQTLLRYGTNSDG